MSLQIQSAKRLLRQVRDTAGAARERLDEDVGRIEAGAHPLRALGAGEQLMTLEFAFVASFCLVNFTRATVYMGVLDNFFEGSTMLTPRCRCCVHT